MAGINQALSPEREFVMGDRITLADICFVAEVALFYNEKPWASDLEKRGLEPILNPKVDGKFSRAIAHFARLSKHPVFAPDVVPYLEKIENATLARQ
jgi:elongation factor 1-gamma